jgi:hypothetical protein
VAEHLGDEERVASGRGVDADGVAARGARGEPLDRLARQRRHGNAHDLRRRQVAEERRATCRARPDRRGG